jgi:hypothetical protein
MNLRAKELEGDKYSDEIRTPQAELSAVKVSTGYSIFFNAFTIL